MIYKAYGKTGKKISRISFGGMRFKEIDNHDKCIEMMVEAAEQGINYFDTAPGYFGTRSEEVFGKGFTELKKRNIPFYSATKTFAAEESAIRREIEAQLKRLKVDTIDFYHIWCITSLDVWHTRKRSGVIKTFQKLKDEGLINHICVSSHLSGDDLKEVLSEESIEGVLLGYSAYNFKFRQSAFDMIRQRNLGCVVMNPLGGGIIPQNPEIFDFIRTQKDETVVQAALRFIFTNDDITSALVGFGEKKEISEAVGAIEGFKEVSPENIKRMKEKIHTAFNDICTGCQYCDSCPEGIAIPKLMDAYNHKILYGDDQKILDRLRWHWNIPPSEAEKCTQCGLCEKACTQHIPIRERLEEIARLA